MGWDSPKDVMPWVGMYIALASLICTLAMTADVVRSFWQWKLWFPNKFFTLNAATITLMAIALKLLVDLTTDMSTKEARTAKISGAYFLVTMLANFLPSLGLMDDKELLANSVALGILVITIFVNVAIQIFTQVLTPLLFEEVVLIFLFPFIWPFSVDLTVSASRKKLEQRYKESQQMVSGHQEKMFSPKELRRYVKKYWMMTETRNSQFVIACSPVSSAFGVICAFFALFSTATFASYIDDLQKSTSEYKWVKQVANGSNSNASSELEEYTRYVVQIEEESKLSKRILRNTLYFITQLLDESEKKVSRNLTKFLEKSKGFNEVVEFDNDHVPPLYPVETHNCWSLVLVTLTTIAISLPNIAHGHFKGLLSSMREGLRIVKQIEECVDVESNYVTRKAAIHVWTEVEVYRTWLQVELQLKARKGKNSKEILKWLGEEAIKVVIQCKSNQKPSIYQSPSCFILASS
ncbi:uncharacterized protein LOC143606122 [Bidens hawaiensis]|uniref:uncharacterized protein LOC143606122 n=1 Tax=Bidens hawaiensis TaxID=980011 RepID=UPI0040497064